MTSLNRTGSCNNRSTGQTIGKRKCLSLSTHIYVCSLYLAEVTAAYGMAVIYILQLFYFSSVEYDAVFNSLMSRFASSDAGY